MEASHKVYHTYPPVESQGTERMPLLSKLLREVWVDPVLAPDLLKGLCLKNFTGVVECLYNFIPQDKGRQTNMKKLFIYVVLILMIILIIILVRLKDFN